MDSITKFNGIDYANTFAKRISVMHDLIRNVLSDHLKNGDTIIDIGGGPGIGAKIIDDLGIMATVINIEPSTEVSKIPTLSRVHYIPLKMTFREALNARMPMMSDCLLIVSSEHEIALCNGGEPEENKKLFLKDMNTFMQRNLRKKGKLVLGFPNYREGSSETEINAQRRLTESLLGHSHPKDEFFTIEEFSRAFGSKPIFYDQKPMNLANEKPEDTILRANAAVFSY